MTITCFSLNWKNKYCQKIFDQNSQQERERGQKNKHYTASLLNLLSWIIARRLHKRTFWFLGNVPRRVRGHDFCTLISTGSGKEKSIYSVAPLSGLPTGKHPTLCSRNLTLNRVVMDIFTNTLPPPSVVTGNAVLWGSREDSSECQLQLWRCHTPLPLPSWHTPASTHSEQQTFWPCHWLMNHGSNPSTMASTGTLDNKGFVISWLSACGRFS